MSGQGFIPADSPMEVLAAEDLGYSFSDEYRLALDLTDSGVALVLARGSEIVILPDLTAQQLDQLRLVFDFNLLDNCQG